LRKKTNLLVVPLLALAAAWYSLLGPASLGGPATYVMVQGVSMKPTLLQGDLVVTRRQESYVPGDIVAFRVPEGEAGEGAVIIHRIIGGSDAVGYLMQGDNKNAPDPWHPRNGDILGRMRLRIPGIAPSVARLREPLPLASLLASVSVVLVLLGESKKAAAPGRRSAQPALARQVGVPRRGWQPQWVALPAPLEEYRADRHPRTRSRRHRVWRQPRLLDTGDLPAWPERPAT
jgi:signal peptidase